MSEHPALALLEFDSVSAGIVAGDSMVKASPLRAIYAGTVHPGKYLVMVTGDTASVEEAVTVGMDTAREAVTDSVFLPDVHPAVTSALTGGPRQATLGREALGIVETSTVAAALDAADAGVKTAEVGLAAIQLADGLGGKGYLLFSGGVADVEAAVGAAVARTAGHGTLVRSDVIPRLHHEMAENLAADLRFLVRIGSGGD